MPALRATASIEMPWKPCSPTISLATSSNCSRRCSALIRLVVLGRGAASLDDKVTVL